MKFGPSRSYWSEDVFQFEAYAGHDPEAISLVGLPDVPRARPYPAAQPPSLWR